MRIALVAHALLAAATPAFAHDFFLDVSKHQVATGEAVSITMRVGSDAEMDELPRSNRRIVRFDALQGAATVPVEGKHGESPAGRVAFDTPGVATIVYQSTHTDIELDGPKFEAYLVEEGLENVAAERKRLGVTASPGRESYARFAKALVTVGGGSEGWNRRVGLPIELVALADPRTGRKAQFQLFYEGKPHPGARVDILRIEKTRLVGVGNARTDAEGNVSLAIPGDGVWLVATTLMRAAPPEARLEGDWESLWASVTFEHGAVRPASTKSGCAASDPGAASIAFVLLAWLIAARRRRYEEATRARGSAVLDDGARRHT